MIGLSLSFCVKEIIHERVNLSDVEKIIAGTCISDREELIYLVNTTYGPIYWKRDPDKGLKIALELWDSDRLDQPRTRGEEHPGLDKGIWLP